MSPREAIAFIRQHGIVLESGPGPVPCLAQAIAGETIRGSWWSHPKGRAIFAATRGVRASRSVLVCRLVNNKVTFVHRCRWAALVRVAKLFPQQRLASLREIHTDSGRHVIRAVPFPDWVPRQVRAQAARLTEAEARLLLRPVAQNGPGPNKAAAPDRGHGAARARPPRSCDGRGG